MITSKEVSGMCYSLDRLFPLPLWERVDASRRARSYFPLPLWERVASKARRVRGTARRNRRCCRSLPGTTTSEAAVSVPFDASPHPSAFGGHPLPQGEREESLFALLTPSSGMIIR